MKLRTILLAIVISLSQNSYAKCIQYLSAPRDLSVMTSGYANCEGIYIYDTGEKDTYRSSIERYLPWGPIGLVAAFGWPVYFHFLKKDAHEGCRQRYDMLRTYLCPNGVIGKNKSGDFDDIDTTNPNATLGTP